MDTKTTTNETRNENQGPRFEDRQSINGAENDRHTEPPMARPGPYHERSFSGSNRDRTYLSKQDRKPHGAADHPATSVDCPYWIEKENADFRFAFREWYRNENGDLRRAVTAPGSDFDGVVLALGALAKKMSYSEWLPSLLCERLWFYSERLSELRRLVNEDIAEWNGSNRDNGNGQPTS